MIQPINQDQLFLQQVALPANANDQKTITDLRDTLSHHQAHCVGMAANMIGVNKAIIAVMVGPLVLIMLNAKIIEKSQPYTTKEGCLSLDGQRQTTRYQKITVIYETQQLEKKTQVFTDFVAQIIQHEIDHCQGILI